MKEPNFYFDDFTEQNYVRLLKVAAEKYTFSFFPDYKKEKIILWRHDVDFSVHRAYSLALHENSLGIKSTFFLHLQNEFYNVFEKEITTLIHKIITLGHQIGIHFDPNYYGSKIGNVKDLAHYINFEKNILQNLFSVKINVFSFHNPDIGDWLKYDQNKVAGLINTYGKYFKKKLHYCSDSNGYWRFRRLEDVLNDDHPSLHILTHPEWWTPDTMSPRERIQRAIDGRSKKRCTMYDDHFTNSQRINVQR